MGEQKRQTHKRTEQKKNPLFYFSAFIKTLMKHYVPINTIVKSNLFKF